MSVGLEAVQLWTEEDRATDRITFGVTNESGVRTALGRIDPRQYRSMDAYRNALHDAFLSCGVRPEIVRAQFPNAQQRQHERQARMQAFAEAMLNSPTFARFMPGSGSYARAFFQDTPGAAFGDAAAYTLGARQPDMFRRPKEEPNPERVKALNRCRDLKRLRDGTTYPGEKRNAQDAMDKLQARWGIKDREI